MTQRPRHTNRLEFLLFGVFSKLRPPTVSCVYFVEQGKFHDVMLVSITWQSVGWLLLRLNGARNILFPI
jgi:hypothetical protein